VKFPCSLFAFLAVLPVGQASIITAIPGPDDQGGMIMPMVTITATSGPNTNPTAGVININFSPSSIPILQPLTAWSPGHWFDENAAWKHDLSPVEGTVPGLPSANAGQGNLFNNQYGFMFMAMPMMGTANVPVGHSLAIRLDSISHSGLRSFNYGNADNRWDEVFQTVNPQVLWSGTMWHNYFTMAPASPAGLYTATFEIFIASTPFTGTTGFAQYDAAAAAAVANPNFATAFVTYQFEVIPEPSTAGLALLGLFAFAFHQRLSKRSRRG
jgi:hypothetical protein